MSKVKNISGGPLDVPMLDRRVEDGETVEVPDFQPASTDEEPLPIVWPANRWEPADPAPVAPEKAAKTTSDKAAV
jgi:hypothetical protein